MPAASPTSRCWPVWRRRGGVFRPHPAAIYGFLANIRFYPIAAPLKAFVDARANLLRHTREMHARVGGPAA